MQAPVTHNAKDYIESGAWIGRQQAFAVIASKCSAAQALALKQMKDSRVYDQIGLSWPDFCLKYVGLGRERVDALIRQYNEFGEAYFRLSQIARISPDSYRELAPKVAGEVVTIDGKDYPMTAANAVKIRAALIKLRRERDEARRAAPPGTCRRRQRRYSAPAPGRLTRRRPCAHCRRPRAMPPRLPHRALRHGTVDRTQPGHFQTHYPALR